MTGSKFLNLKNLVFCTDGVYPYKNGVGARSAQVSTKPARTKNSSVRIAASAWTMKPSARKRRSLKNPLSSFF
jgi:hypothetical protein